MNIESFVQSVVGAPGALSPEAIAFREKQVAEAEAALFYIERIPEDVLSRLLQFSQHYRIGSSDAAEESYWMNHCSFCGVGQDDFELYCEPEGAFMPISAEAAASIQLSEVIEPFVAQAAGYAYAPEFFDQAQR